MSYNSDIETRVAKHSQKLKDHERRLQIQEEKVDNLREISAILKELSKQNERNEKRFEQITVVLDGINTSLLSLNHDVKHLKEKQETMDNRVDQIEKERIKELENLKREREKEQKEARKEKRNFVIGVISGVIVAVLSTATLVWLGFK